MILSIGMIVKNEEKYLDECLSALKPILDNVKSELIIVDTGSTDNTIKIAKKYTDKIYYFKWCKDFAKARNESLKNASGEWFLYVDADEILNDANEIIDFFNSGEYKHYSSASYSIKNYRNDNKTSYSYVRLQRFHKINPNTKFIGIIHEYIPVVDPTKHLYKTEFEHYGYVFTNPEFTKLKNKRNIELLEIQLKDNPKNPRIRAQLSDTYLVFGDYNKAIKHAKKGVELTTEGELLNYYFGVQLNLISSYQAQGNYKMVINESINYFNTSKNIVLSHIDVFFMLTNAYYNLKEYDKCIATFESYIDVIKINRSKGIHTFDESVRALMYGDEFSINNLILVAISAYIETNNIKKAYKILEFETLSDLGNIFNYDLKYFHLELELMKLSKNFSRIESLYIKIKNSSKCESLIKDFEISIENFMRINKDESEIINLILIALSKIENKTNYIKLNEIRLNYKNDDVTRDKILLLINDIDEVNLHFSDLLYYIIDMNMPISILANKINVKSIFDISNLLYDKYEDFINKVSNYAYDSNDINSSFILSNIYESLLTKLTKENRELCETLYKKYIVEFDKFFSFTFNIQNLSSNDDKYIYFLPNNLRFGYYCIKAEKYLDSNNVSNYIKMLKIALLQDDRMRNVIDILAKKAMEESEKNNELTEFEKLAITVKQNIFNLIRSNLKEDAKILLKEYKLINPKDPEIIKIESELSK